jgi:hypothetical protein
VLIGTKLYLNDVYKLLYRNFSFHFDRTKAWLPQVILVLIGEHAKIIFYFSWQQIMGEQASWQVTIPRITCSTHTGEINTEVISWYIHYNKLLYRNFSFHFDSDKSMAATGNSCFDWRTCKNNLFH